VFNASIYSKMPLSLPGCHADIASWYWQRQMCSRGEMDITWPSGRGVI